MSRAKLRAHRARACGVAPGEQQDELISAVAADDVIGPRAFAERARKAHERAIPRRVAELVVDRLERVEVHERHGQWGLRAPRMGYLRGQPVAHGTSIVKLRERVEESQPRKRSRASDSRDDALHHSAGPVGIVKLAEHVVGARRDGLTDSISLSAGGEEEHRHERQPLLAPEPAQDRVRVGARVRPEKDGRGNPLVHESQRVVVALRTDGRESACLEPDRDPRRNRQGAHDEDRAQVRSRSRRPPDRSPLGPRRARRGDEGLTVCFLGPSRRDVKIHHCQPRGAR